MATPISLTIPHHLGRAEARRRIDSGFTQLIHRLPGGTGQGSERWEGDRLVFSVASMGQTVSGVVEVFDAEVRMQIDLPGVLGLVAGAFKGRLAKAGQRLLTKR